MHLQRPGNELTAVSKKERPVSKKRKIKRHLTSDSKPWSSKTTPSREK
jgi:hypothetical protein